MSFQATVLTLFPAMFPGPLGVSLAGQALAQGKWWLDAINIRDFATDRHHTVDDTPFGGGAGMVMRADVVDAALQAVADRPGPKIYLSPRGRVLDQTLVQELAQSPGVTLLCGRFEGLDQRLIDERQLQEVSLGDFVLSGGEPAALALLDACVRLLPGVVGSAATLTEESFEDGLLEYPHYTRPPVWQGREVPEVLLSGHHGRIAAWRRAESEQATRLRRPDLWHRYQARRSGKSSSFTETASGVAALAQQEGITK